ncbi:MAG: histidine--tRNA ligase [Candidatus Izemoplasmataceae bacterium]|jgi:histidyl-tRNA synthetase
MIQKMKGTYDLYEDMPYMQEIEKKIMTVSKLFQYNQIRTPHFESSELFHRGVGESTDIVSKETYDFIDRGNRSNTLRPEGTAGIVRAYIENKLYAERITPHKFYYLGSMFRYERPQKGRFREFIQFGAEAFGSDRPEMDAEIIAYAVTLLKSLKLKGITVYVNSLGDKDSKPAYHKALKAHLKDSVKSLCGDCQKRYEDNPLRILDCKVDQEHEAIKTAPKPIEYLTKEDKEHFDKVCQYLDAMHINYEIDSNLVRGLDYYTHTVFEIKVSKELLGNQNTICGGGRYNHLVETLDGPPTPAVGFGFGLERVIVAMKAANLLKVEPYLHTYFLVLGDEARTEAMAIMQRLRLGGITSNMDYLNKSMKAQFKQSDYQNARFIVIIGEEEIKSKTVNLKDTLTKESLSIPINDIYVTIVDRLTTKTTCEDCEHKGE